MLLPFVVASCVAAETPPVDDPIEPEPTEPNPVEPDPVEPDPETPAEVSARLLDQWMQCMQLGDFQTANMAPAWAKLRAQNDQQCQSCHATGGNGFVATEIAQFMFDVLKSEKYYFLQYFTVDLTSLETAQVVINRQSFRGVALGQVPHAEHPRFDPDNNAGMTALERFYELTRARLVTECAPPPM